MTKGRQTLCGFIVQFWSTRCLNISGEVINSDSQVCGGNRVTQISWLCILRQTLLMIYLKKVDNDECLDKSRSLSWVISLCPPSLCFTFTFPLLKVTFPLDSQALCSYALYHLVLCTEEEQNALCALVWAHTKHFLFLNRNTKTKLFSCVFFVARNIPKTCFPITFCCILSSRLLLIKKT